jgi:hypothetical protein
MKKILILTCALVASMQVYAKLDTVTVVSHQDVVIKTDPNVGETFYARWAEFPAASESYRKVMIQLKFECAPGMQCGEIDYINNIILGKKGGYNGTPLNYEIARLITPQGFNWNSSSGWNNTWYFDVTDFAMLLHDSVEIIYRHTGYENNTDRGWKINVNFICIKGPAVAEPVQITQLWSGTYTVGDNSDSIEHHLTPINTTLDAQTGFVVFKGIHSGHGSDNNGCMEYCRKYRNLKWDGSLVNQKYIWRGDCSYNSVYPQSGTWVFNRAGWCPGSTVGYDDNIISGFAAGSTHTIDMDLEPYYNSFSLHGNLNTTAYLVEYKTATNSLDAGIENIIAPSSEQQFSRDNPICRNPIIVIRNNGSTPLTKATIEYGCTGGNMTTYQWTGNLSLFRTDTVVLTTPVEWNSNNGTFVANIKDVNGGADQNADDNKMISKFNAPIVWPGKIVISLLTNKDATENSYKLINNNYNQTVYSRKGFKSETLYNDTISLSPGSCYTFYFSDEDSSSYGNKLNKDGLDFGALVGNPNYEGAGTLKIKNALTGSVLKDITGNAAGPFGTKGGDFGGKYVMNFMCAFSMATPQVEKVKTDIQVYPNPVSHTFYVDYATASDNATMYLYDLQGKQLQSLLIDNAVGTKAVDVSNLTPGIYTLRFVSGDGTIVRKVVKR